MKINIKFYKKDLESQSLPITDKTFIQLSDKRVPSWSYMERLIAKI